MIYHDLPWFISIYLSPDISTGGFILLAIKAMVKTGPSCLGDSNLDEIYFSFHIPVGSFLLVIKKMVKIGPSCLGDSNLDEISFLAAGNLAFPSPALFSGSESCQIEVDLF